MESFGAPQAPVSAGEKKVLEYVERIKAGESKETVLEGLPDSFKSSINERLERGSEASVAEIPPQYEGMNSEMVEFIWDIPEYLDPQKTKREYERKERALDALRKREVVATVGEQSKSSPQWRIEELQEDLGIEESPLGIDERKKLSGWSASFELAKIAGQQGVDLTSLTREQYVDYAIQNSLAIDDTQLRASSIERTATSPEQVVSLMKEKRKAINEAVDKLFARFSFEIKEKAGQDNRFLEEGIRVRQGTKDSNSWLFFAINGSTPEGATETYKSYASVKDLNTFTPERFKDLMRALRDAGYNGDIKTFQDLVDQGPRLNDQIVMHGATEADAKLALSVAEKFFGSDLDQKGFGKDEVVDGKNTSYSQILAQKIIDAVKGGKK